MAPRRGGFCARVCQRPPCGVHTTDNPQFVTDYATNLSAVESSCVPLLVVFF